MVALLIALVVLILCTIWAAGQMSEYIAIRKAVLSL